MKSTKRLLQQTTQPDLHTFGFHQNLPALKQLCDQAHLTFVANAGWLARLVTADNYRGETSVSLFAHTSVTEETKRSNLFNECVRMGSQ